MTKPVSKGLLSKDGWHVVDDTKSALFDNNPQWPWRIERNGSVKIDWYFFGHGKLNYEKAMNEFGKISGMPPLLPFRAYGI